MKSLLFLLLVLTLTAASTLPAVLLVPGAFHRASIYGELTTVLASHDYTSIHAIDLPSIGSQAAYVDREPDIAAVRDLLVDYLDQGRDVVLVGHSYGGTVIGEAVDGLQHKSVTAPGATSGKILGLIMLSGFIPTIAEVTTQSHPDIRLISPPNFNFNDGTSTVTADGDLATFPPSVAFYNLLSSSSAAYWASQLLPSSFAALNATAKYVPYTGDFRCVYVTGSNDHSVSPEFAESVWLSQEGAVWEVVAGDGDHSPMLSRVQETVAVIRSVAEGL